jgi:hypothetical protein
MTRIGVVLPTIRGRESLLERTQDAYLEATPSNIELVIVVPKDADCIGDAWNAGAKALKGCECEYLHLGADDLLPGPVWAEAGISAAEGDVYPSPRITLEDGSLESCGTLGAGFFLPEVRDGTPATSSGMPFLPFDLWESIQPLPSLHYYCDDLIAFMARSQGLRCEVRRDYHFTHLKGQFGTPDVVRKAMAHRETMLGEVASRFAPRKLEQVA